MLHKQAAAPAQNPTKLKDLPANFEYWSSLDIIQIRDLLWHDLISRNDVTPLPQDKSLHVLLESVLRRMDQLITDKLIQQCHDFLLLTGRPSLMNAEVAVGEAYLQIIAIANFYLRCFTEAAELAGLLGNKYFLMDRDESHALSAHFNKIAGLAYQNNDYAEKACSHFNKYVYATYTAGFYPTEMSDILHYLLTNNSLIVTSDTSHRERRFAPRDDEAVNTKLADLYARVDQQEVIQQNFYECCMPEAKVSLVQAWLDFERVTKAKLPSPAQPVQKLKKLEDGNMPAGWHEFTLLLSSRKGREDAFEDVMAAQHHPPFRDKFK